MEDGEKIIVLKLIFNVSVVVYKVVYVDWKLFGVEEMWIKGEEV